MCGINGITSSNRKVVENMNIATKHRGPDGTGVFSDDRITLGQNLLAITETPSVAKQPYVSADKRFVLVYNGEIYNYEILRTELMKSGEHCETRGDTEVLFKGLMRFGAEYLMKLDGMFALAFYDREKGTLLLARDPSGMKPLYYGEIGGVFVFSSEIRGLFAAGTEPILDIDAAKLFFTFGYVPGPTTLIRGISKLPPGAFLEVQLRDKTRKEGWFTPSVRSAPDAGYDAEVLREKIHSAVMEHTMGLRPFGLFLSGGLDSTIILHELMQENASLVNTYTTRFDTANPLYNEDADLAQALTKTYHINHHELLVTEQDMIDAYPKAIIAMEEPRYNHSVGAYWLLAQRAAKDITIVLDGSGGDELFLGYPRYLSADIIGERYRKGPAALLDLLYSFKGRRDGVVNFPRNVIRLEDPLAAWAYMSRIVRTVGNCALPFLKNFDLVDAARILGASTAPALSTPLPDRLNMLAELDRLFWLADEDFLRTDKIIMHFGMEGRFPFVARDIVQYANGIPSAQKLAHGPKSLLREAYREKLPDSIITKRKTGWTAPVPEWMSSKFGDMVREVLTADYYRPTSALFNMEELQLGTLHGVEQFTLAHLKQFLPVVQFQIWAREFGVRLP